MEINITFTKQTSVICSGISNGEVIVRNDYQLFFLRRG
jgi:hypothetical protein